VLAGVQRCQKLHCDLHGRVVVEQEVTALNCPWGWVIVLMNSMAVGEEGDRKLFQMEVALKL
jgi:hypothetical protein